MMSRQQFLRILSVLVSLELALAIGAVAGHASERDIGAHTVDDGVEMTWGVRIPMSDGVHLNATIYRPPEMPVALPVIFTMTPYISDRFHTDAQYFAKNGYVFVIVDSRGRGNSEGRFNAFMQEAKDGYDVTEWLAGQPFSDGQVAMRGGSYGGYNQWATAKEFPPSLKTIMPVASAFAGVDFPMFNGVPYPYIIRWLTLTSGRTPNNVTFADEKFWISKYRALYLSHAPFKSLDAIVGNLSTEFQEWVAHPERGPYWDAMNPTDEEFARINLPIITVTGHYDGDQPGAMEFYRRHMRFASEEARNRHYLVIGPWDHAGTRRPKKEFGGLTFGDNSVLDMNAFDKAWYDWTLKGGKKPEFLKKRVAYFVAGANHWRYADSLADIAEETLVLHLTSPHGTADSVFASGLLSPREPARGERPDRYTYDPLDTSRAELETEPNDNYLVDQRLPLSIDGDGLIYHSAAFDQDTEISGYVTFEAWMALDVPDTDFSVVLYEVLGDGSSIMLTRTVQRARYRKSMYEPELVKPGQVNRYVFDRFFFFSRRIAKGSRLRLVITAPNSINAQKNYNSGGVVAEETGDDARTATITLYHDIKRPSALTLPIVRHAPEVDRAATSSQAGER